MSSNLAQNYIHLMYFIEGTPPTFNGGVQSSET